MESFRKQARRILVLWFPRLATDRLQRRWKKQGVSPDTPLVVAAKVDNALRLSAIDRKAARLGLEEGMPLANARAMLPALTVMQANEPADRQLLERIADWCDRFTPFVALHLPDTLLLDVTGVPHLFGGEKALTEQAVNGLTRQGFTVRAAIAGTIPAARALAWYGHGTIVPLGGEAAAMAPLPVEALDLDAAVVQAFHRAGLKTVGQVAGRGRAELTARFRKEMVFALDHALGRAEKPISARRPLPDYRAECRFPEPVATHDTILATLKSLAQRLASLLEENGQGMRRLEAAFFRADGAVRRIAVETGHPLRQAEVVERLFREKLDALDDPLDPGFGYDLIRLSVSRAERAASETAGFDADLNAEREIRFLVDRLAARFGSHRVLSFQPNDTHIPEAAWIDVPAQYARPSPLPWKPVREAGEAPRRPLRFFAAPERVDVLSVGADGVPLKFRWRRVVHAARHVEGPERIAMEWWRHQTAQPTRDYFRVEDENGRRFWLYRDGIRRETAEPRWFMQGVFA
ncbi:MAG: DNA polymerase Y family protein [Alphaproteobacteria bacterium]|nr:DNA polymerase Y family protein [Alphaproteobacteria bacterium]